jgi:hypothetical protein
MTAQDALVQISLQEAPFTAVMTTNLTRFVTDPGEMRLGRDSASSTRVADIFTVEPCRVRRYRARVYTTELSGLSRGSSVRMTEYLIAVRAVMILWTNLAVMPAEIVFDAIEAEFERRGVEL